VISREIGCIYVPVGSQCAVYAIRTDFGKQSKRLKIYSFKGYKMKKFFLLFLALGAVAFAGEGESMINRYGSHSCCNNRWYCKKPRSRR